MVYRGPAGPILMPDEWYTVYLALLPLAGSESADIRGRIYQFLKDHKHPGVCDALDA